MLLPPAGTWQTLNKALRPCGWSDSLCCRLWRKAAALAASQCEDELCPDAGSQLASSLLYELCPPGTRLRLIPDNFLGDQEGTRQLQAFLQETQLTHVSLVTNSRMFAAMLDRLLPPCTYITHFECHGVALTCSLPPSLQRLYLNRHRSPVAVAVDDARVLLARLSGLQSLEKLELVLPAQLRLPACLASCLPVSLHSIIVSFSLDDTVFSSDEDDDPAAQDYSGELQLAALSQAAGCRARLFLEVDALACQDATAVVFQSFLLPGLRAIAPFHSLQVHLDVICMAGLLPALAQLQLHEFCLTLYSSFIHPLAPEPAMVQPIAVLPACGSIEICPVEGQVSLCVAWAALSGSPGVRHLGAEKRPLSGAVQVIDCTGLPEAFPLAVVVWGDLGLVQGVPSAEFELHATQPDMNVWRNAAAVGLERCVP